MWQPLAEVVGRQGIRTRDLQENFLALFRTELGAHTKRKEHHFSLEKWDGVRRCLTNSYLRQAEAIRRSNAGPTWVDPTTHP